MRRPLSDVPLVEPRSVARHEPSSKRSTTACFREEFTSLSRRLDVDSLPMLMIARSKLTSRVSFPHW